MRVAYFVPFRGGRETGIYRKVREHCEEWAKLGATVGLFVGTGSGAVRDWADVPGVERVVAMPSGALATLRARESLWRSIRVWEPDVVYARHGLVHPGVLWTATARPVVLEINSNDVGEFAATSRWRSRYSSATRDGLLARTAGLVFVSDELARSPHFAAGPSRRITIGNGIRLGDHPTVAAPSNDNPRLVFIGHAGSTWHGLEHLLELAEYTPNWDFDIIGTTQADLPETAPRNVTAHGPMIAEEYRPILEQADVCVGSLALYRNDMDEASTLKVREYLASGIPTIIGYQETDFGDPPPFLLQIPNRPDGVRQALPAITDFVESAPARRFPQEEVAHLDVGVKEAKRLAFITSIAEATG